MRVYELASQYEISSKALLKVLEELGILAKSHMSVVSDEDAVLVAERFAGSDREETIAAVEKGPRYEVERAKPKAKRMSAREKLEAKRRQQEEAKAKGEPDPAAVEVVDAPAATATEIPPPKRPRVQVPKPPEPEPATASASAPAKKSEAPKTDVRKMVQAAAMLREQIQSDTQTKVAEPERPKRPPRKAAPPEKPAPAPADPARTDGRSKKKRRGKVDTAAIQDSVRQSLSRIEIPKRPGPSAPQRKRPSRRVREDKKERAARHRAREEAQRTPQDILRVTEFATVQDLAAQLAVKPSEIIGKLMGLGTMATMTQRLERDTIELLAAEYEIGIEWLQEYGEDLLEVEDAAGDETQRSPVVTVMGHVDHGKTSLLDYIRKTNVIAGESGGITQHIGAYQVETSRGKVTFLDTPGHEAFSAMRARGAQVTDIVVIVVAADDKVMPQTIEAIDHARASDCPIIIAINKIDLPAADPAQVKQQLMQHNVLVEEFGGEVQEVEISAKQGTNVDKLLEAISLQAELMELTAVHEGPARGAVVESQKDPGRGISFTVLVNRGTLRVGDAFVSGLAGGRVRAMHDEHDQELIEVVPGQPAVILGANDVPAAGDAFAVLGSEREAKEIAGRRQQLQREQTFHAPKRQTTLENLYELVQGGDLVELNLVVKGDVGGSVEALCDSLMNLSTDKVAVKVIRKGVGGINESDINLAAASDALIVGFHLHPPPSVMDLARDKNVSIEIFQVIYEAVEQVKKAMEGLLTPLQREIAAGAAEVRELFKVPKLGVVAGSYVTDGTIRRNAKLRVVRDQVEVFEGVISSLRRFKEDVREVNSGFECGIGVVGFNDIKVGDVLQTYDVEEVKQEL